MTNETYNGWTNRITWLTALRFDTAFQEIIEQMKEDNEDLENPLGIDEVANAFQDLVEEFISEEVENLSVFLQDAIDLSSIEYYEIADNFID